MKKLLIAVGVVAAAASVSMGSASAATPAVKACVGTTSSAAAQANGGNGEIRSGYAKGELPGLGRPGFGDEMQFLQAGNVPDFIAPNTCNDVP